MAAEMPQITDAYVAARKEQVWGWRLRLARWLLGRTSYVIMDQLVRPSPDGRNGGVQGYRRDLEDGSAWLHESWSEGYHARLKRPEGFGREGERDA